MAFREDATGALQPYTGPATKRVRVRESTGETSKSAAQAVLNERLGDRVARRRGIQPDMCFSALLEQFEALELPNLSPGSADSYRDSFKPFRSFFIDQQADPLIDDLTTAAVKHFVKWRRAQGVSGHTVGRDWRTLRRLFNFAIEMEYTNLANPSRASRNRARTSARP